MDIVTDPGASPDGTTVVTCESETTVNVVVTVPNFTAVAKVNPVPLSVTGVPSVPLGGVKLVIFGFTLNVCGLVSFVEPVVTVTVPVFAPTGTVAVR
jgi:hypothetical protein